MIDGPTRAPSHPDFLLDCEKAMEAEFRAEHDRLVADGLTQADAAQRLLATTDEGGLGLLVLYATIAGWPADTARRALLRLAQHNLERVQELN